MNLKICKKCLMLSTRPRITFDDKGICSACQWKDEKSNLIDWNKRKELLLKLCDLNRSKNGDFDVIVPVSGGKDSSMIAHKLKYEFNMNPLCININQSIKATTKTNEINLNNFINIGFDTIRVYPSSKVIEYLDYIGLCKYGQPYLGWLSAMTLIPLKIALKFKIPFIMYAEEGESEYGGTSRLKNSYNFSIDDIKELYLSNIKILKYLKNFDHDYSWWKFPEDNEINNIKPSICHWSYFFYWDSNYNYEYSKKYCGLVDASHNVSGTYNIGSQTDSVLYFLHTYFMYLKFGFGRCTQDVCIDIRSGKMTREKGIELIQKYDEEYPREYEDLYLDYYNISKQNFMEIIDKHANKNLLFKKNGIWKKKFNLRDFL